MIKYPVNTTVDKREIFNYPFITDIMTVSYINKIGRVMFIIRGLPYTGKTAVSKLLMETYPNAVYCSAVKYLNTLSPNDEITLPEQFKFASIKLCQNKVKDACMKNEQFIIVQNSHVKRFEVQPFLDFAALYDYTVIMIDTSNRFEITPEALKKDKPNGLNVEYLTRRCNGYHDILPAFTGWFISSDDSLYILNFMLKSLEPLLEDNEFCKLFRVGDAEELRKCFNLRKLLSCVAGYFEDPLAMKEYDSSDEVQSSYGRAFIINIVGYLITASGIIGIAQVDEPLKCLTKILEMHVGNKKTDKNNYVPRKGRKKPISDELRDKLKIGVTSKNIVEYGKTFKFQESVKNSPGNTTGTLKDWSDYEDISIKRSSFIHLGQRNFDLFDIPKIKREFDSLKSLSDECGIIPGCVFDQLGNKTKYCKITRNGWLVKAPQIICVKTVFTAFYP